jgi:preprotein translocase subunit YajC
MFMLAEAAAGAGAGGDAPVVPGAQGDPIMGMLTMLVPMMIIGYFLLIRPEKKRRKETADLLNAVKAKDKVATIGGLIGIVVEVDGDEVVILADAKKDVKLRFKKSAIGAVINEENKKEEKK